MPIQNYIQHTNTNIMSTYNVTNMTSNKHFQESTSLYNTYIICTHTLYTCTVSNHETILGKCFSFYTNGHK